MSSNGEYLRATKHPWPCLLFLLPLLAAYELGVDRLSGGQPDALRNGADSWLRQGFAERHSASLVLVLLPSS